MKLYVLLNYLFLVFGTNDNEWWKKVAKLWIMSSKLNRFRTNEQTYAHTWAHTLSQMENRAAATTITAVAKKQQINNKYEITFHTCNAIGIIENDSYLLSTNFLSIPYSTCCTSNHAIFFLLLKFAFLRTHLICFFILLLNLPSRVSSMMWASIIFFFF